MKKSLLLIAAAAALSTSAQASSDAAWDAFRETVATACTKAAESVLGETTASVDPNGTASYGLAIMRSVPAPEIGMICVYDKKTGTVELGGQMQSAATPAAARRSAQAER
jgi:hypothetical protein